MLFFLTCTCTCPISPFSQLDGALMIEFDSLINLDLRRNNIRAIDNSLCKLYIRNIKVYLYLYAANLTNCNCCCCYALKPK